MYTLCPDLIVPKSVALCLCIIFLTPRIDCDPKIALLNCLFPLVFSVSKHLIVQLLLVVTCIVEL